MTATDKPAETVHTSSEQLQNDSTSDEAFVLGTDITWAHLEERLKAALGTSAKFGANKKIESIGVGQGFMSAMGRLYPEWTHQKDVLPRSFIVKIPSGVVILKYLKATEVNKEFQKSAGLTEEETCEHYERMIRMVHNTEIGFYEINESLVRKLKAPKAFVAERFEKGCLDGLLILEDLCDAHIVPIYKNVSVEEATQVIDELAKVHAYSLCSNSWLKIGGVNLKDLITLNGQSAEGMMVVSELAAELDPERLCERMKKLRKIFSEVFDLDFEQNLYKEMDMKPVLVHGDLWSSNVMWRGEDGSRQLVALIDWQLVHPGCPSQDLARFICSALSGDDRRKHWESLLERYYRKLEENLDQKVPFTLQQVKESFVQLLPFHMFLVLPTLGPLVLHQIKQTMPERYDEIREAMAEKAVALVDDIFHYYKLNSTK